MYHEWYDPPLGLRGEVERVGICHTIIYQGFIYEGGGGCHGLNWSFFFVCVCTFLFVYVVGLLAPFVVDLYLALGWFH